MASNKPSSGPLDAWPLRIFALAFGGLLGLALLKFPNPAVVEHLIEAPTNAWEFALSGWPVRYAYPLFAILVLAGLALMRWVKTVPKLLALLPLAWLLWVILSAGQTIDPKVTRLTLVHFILCTTCFYLGLLIVGRLKGVGWFFGGVAGAFMLVLMTGFEQHFGGLEASRQNYWMYIYPTLKTPPPPELLKRMQSTRIFSTLFYANSLAGALLLITPLVLGLIADARARFTIGARWLLGAGVGVGAAGCLFWSGSKGGWLIALAMGVLVLLRLPVPRRVKVMVVSALLVAGVAGFTIRYLGFFQRGAPSVVQRFNYWNAALKNVAAHPWFGSGPGTFATVYARVKAPEAEMAKLTHNDYLQQASDSGLLAGILFIFMIGWVLIATRKVWQSGDWLTFGVWLGLAGFAIQSTVEFGLYVPATGWCWFGMAGWLTARNAASGLTFDNPKSST
jgi:O-antigen ligase